MQKRYLVCPEQVFCGNDEDVHFATAEELIQLYRVDPKECVIYDGEINSLNRELTLLLPDYSGEYEVPDAC